MANPLPTLLAALTLALLLLAVVAMTRGELLVAGLSFLSASVVIYLRETRAT